MNCNSCPDMRVRYICPGESFMCENLAEKNADGRRLFSEKYDKDCNKGSGVAKEMEEIDEQLRRLEEEKVALQEKGEEIARRAQVEARSQKKEVGEERLVSMLRELIGKE